MSSSSRRLLRLLVLPAVLGGANLLNMLVCIVLWQFFELDDGYAQVSFIGVNILHNFGVGLDLNHRHARGGGPLEMSLLILVNLGVWCLLGLIGGAVWELIRTWGTHSRRLLRMPSSTNVWEELGRAALMASLPALLTPPLVYWVLATASYSERDLRERAGTDVLLPIPPLPLAIAGSLALLLFLVALRLRLRPAPAPPDA